jgi:nuclear receptor subfamily 1 group F protein 4
VSDIQRLNQAILKTLKFELAKTHKLPFKGDISVLDALLARLPMLREISQLHMESLGKFRKSHPLIEFPALHKELFSFDA